MFVAIPTPVELLWSSLYLTRPVPGAGHGPGHCMGFALLASPVLPKTRWREGNEEEKHTLSSSFVPVCHKCCWLSAAWACVTSPSALCSLSVSEVCRDKGNNGGIALTVLGRMCKKLNLDGKSIPSSCRTLNYSVLEENHQSILICSQRSFKLLQEYFYLMLRF